jgi:hypothetical protein
MTKREWFDLLVRTSETGGFPSSDLPVQEPLVMWVRNPKWRLRRELVAELTGSKREYGGETLAWRLVRSHLYAVKRSTGAGSEPYLFVAVLRRSPSGMWMFKGWTESGGPVPVECPPEFFDLVGPAPNQLAAQWRLRCAYHAELKRRRPKAGEAWLSRWWHKPLDVVSERPLLAIRRGGDERVIRAWRQEFGRLLWRPSWGTSTVLALMASIRADPAPEALPILADALQDAGCQDELLLADLRLQGDLRLNLLGEPALEPADEADWMRRERALAVFNRMWEAANK